jgi:sulfhydrogenase subunit gamma (sulfur reductase)
MVVKRIMPMNTIVPCMATLIGIQPLSGETTLFTLEMQGGEGSGLAFIPGQFVQLSVPGGGECPVTLANAPSGNATIELCVRRAGHVTTLLHSRKVGDQLGIRGPFGVGFPVDEMAGRDVLLLAGGLGIAPIRSLLCHILERRDEFGVVTLMYGAREPSAILFREEMAELACRREVRLLLTVDFLTEGPDKGLACNVGLLPELLDGVELRPEATYAAICGPPPLYRCLIGELNLLGVPDEQIFLSLERRMKCGVGHCCHCAFGQLYCCTDGPVFRYIDIRDVEGAL